MLEGLEAAEIYFSQAILENQVFRVDSQYFKKQHLLDELNIHKFPIERLGNLAFITDGQHGYHEVDEASPIRHLTAKNASEWFANDIGADRIASWVDENNKRSSLQKNDLILSTRGTVGYCSIVDIDVLPANIDQDVARIKLENPLISAPTLLAYLNSSVGQDWMERNQTGMVQQGLALWRVREMPIPIFSATFQAVVDRVISTSKQNISASKANYSQAETLLLDVLNLADFSPSTENTNIKSFQESFGVSGRLDAEYFQPKFDELEAKITKTHELVSMGSLLMLNQRGTQPDYADEGLPVINSKHVREGEVVLSDNRVANLPDSEKSLFIQKNDVLINGTGVGTIGRSAPYLHEQNAIPDNHVTILRTDKLNPIFLSVYLNSIAGKYQVDKYFKGSSGQIELYPKDIDCFYVPLVVEAIQTEIAALVQQSFTLKAESERLLEVAKRAVEIAIEQDEPAALAYIEAQS